MGCGCGGWEGEGRGAGGTLGMGVGWGVAVRAWSTPLTLAGEVRLAIDRNVQGWEKSSHSLPKSTVQGNLPTSNCQAHHHLSSAFPTTPSSSAPSFLSRPILSPPPRARMSPLDPCHTPTGCGRTQTGRPWRRSRLRGRTRTRPSLSVRSTHTSHKPHTHTAWSMVGHGGARQVRRCWAGSMREGVVLVGGLLMLGQGNGRALRGDGTK